MVRPMRSLGRLDVREKSKMTPCFRKSRMAFSLIDRAKTLGGIVLGVGRMSALYCVPFFILFCSLGGRICQLIS